MTIFHSRKEIVYGAPNDFRCSICDNQLMPHMYPILFYHPALAICRECAVRNKNGLIADLIELEANVEMRKVQPSNVRLVREHKRGA